MPSKDSSASQALKVAQTRCGHAEMGAMCVTKLQPLKSKIRKLGQLAKPAKLVSSVLPPMHKFRKLGK